MSVCRQNTITRVYNIITFQNVITITRQLVVAVILEKNDDNKQRDLFLAKIREHLRIKEQGKVHELYSPS